MVSDMNLCKCPDSLYLKKISSKSQISAKDECDGYLLDSSEKECRKIVESLKGKKKIIAILGGDNAFNRRALETLTMHYLVSVERGDKRDSLKQRDSGFNHVLAREALKKNVALVINMNEILALEGIKKARTLGRVMQNILVCRKIGCKIFIGSFSSNLLERLSEQQRKDFGSSLGMSSQQVAACTTFQHNV